MELNTVFPRKRTPIESLKLGKHGSYMPSLQRLCFLRRSVHVAGLTYIRFGPYYDALIGPSPKKSIIVDVTLQGRLKTSSYCKTFLCFMTGIERRCIVTDLDRGQAPSRGGPVPRPPPSPGALRGLEGGRGIGGTGRATGTGGRMGP